MDPHTEERPQRPSSAITADLVGIDFNPFRMNSYVPHQEFVKWHRVRLRTRLQGHAYAEASAGKAGHAFAEAPAGWAPHT